MTKKFNLKLPSMLALSLFGATLTAQHAHAAESTTDQSTNKNVIDQQNDVVKANKAKKAVSNAAQNVSGVQAYHNPSLVKSSDTTSGQTYDAKLDTLTDQTHAQTSQQQNAKNQQQTKQAKQQAATTTARQNAQTYNQNAAQSNKTKQQANANTSTTTKQQATQAANTSLKSQNNVETTNQTAVSTQNTAQKQSNSVTTYQGRVGGMGS
nr:mannosyl-glycoprotein endo-beta-N-acetylglucosamidase [Staphylococcus lugdunensis]